MARVSTLAALSGSLIPLPIPVPPIADIDEFAIEIKAHEKPTPVPIPEAFIPPDTTRLPAFMDVTVTLDSIRQSTPEW
jgi:hypothetical protein